MRGLRAPTCSGVQHLRLHRPRAAALRSRPLQLSLSAVASKQVIDSEGKEVETKLHEEHAPHETPVPAQMGNGARRKTVLDSTDLEGDSVLEKELSDNGELTGLLVDHLDCRSCDLGAALITRRPSAPKSCASFRVPPLALLQRSGSMDSMHTGRSPRPNLLKEVHLRVATVPGRQCAAALQARAAPGGPS